MIVRLNPIVIGSVDYKKNAATADRVPTYYLRIILDEQTEMAVEVVAVSPSSPCQMLIGRDLLSRWLMTWDGPADRLIISY